MTIPPDEPTLLYAGALNYLDAAILVLDNKKSTGRDGLILPTHTMIGLAIEMFYKAVYLKRGGDPQTLKGYQVRHNLKRLRQEAAGVGFTTSVANINEVIDLIGDNYAAHEYRYMKPDTEVSYIQNGEVATRAVNRLADEVAVELGLPPRPE